jgi:hypothetical protein
MNAQIEAIYGRIGQALVDLIGGDFARAYARVEMADDFGSVGVFYERGDGTWRYLTDESDTLFDLFAQMRGAGVAAGMGAWSQATFELAGSGRFSVHFGFDDISDLGQGSARRDAWMKKHLGPNARVLWS